MVYVLEKWEGVDMLEEYRDQYGESILSRGMAVQDEALNWVWEGMN